MIEIEDPNSDGLKPCYPVIVRTRPASKTEFVYTFEETEIDGPLELVKKVKITGDSLNRQERLVAPNVTPAVREALISDGYELA